MLGAKEQLVGIRAKCTLLVGPFFVCYEENFGFVFNFILVLTRVQNIGEDDSLEAALILYKAYSLNVIAWRYKN
jgi:hypothetical protein